MIPNIKKIIAREGLVILAIIISGYILMYGGDRIFGIGLIGAIGAILFFWGVPLYLLIRFIIWAIRMS